MNVDPSIRNLTPQERRQSAIYDVKNNIIPGIIFGTGLVAANAIIKENRADSFVSTMKNCAKYEAKTSRETLSGFLKFIKLEKAGKYIEKLGNKKMFGLSLAGNIIASTAICSALRGSSK